MSIADKTEQSSRKSSVSTRRESKEHKSSMKWVFLTCGFPRVRVQNRYYILFIFRSFELGAQRPSPGSIGKLRISSEMRHKLEMVTSTHSVRSTAKPEKPSLSQVSNMNVPRKLEDNRRLLLEQQLG